MSYLEFFSTIIGSVAVLLASFNNVWNWVLSLISVSMVFFLFYQVQLYPDMGLQAFFFVTGIIGWWRWLHPKPGEEDGRKKELRISLLSYKKRIGLIALAGACTITMGLLVGKLHLWVPMIFRHPSAFPFADSFVAVMSVIGALLLVERKIESWYLWIIIDIVACVVYYQRGIKFISLQYLVFCFNALFAIIVWTRKYRNQTPDQ